MLPAFLYACETWTLTRDLRRRLISFGTRSLRRILGYHWSDFVSNERLLRGTQRRFVTCIVHEHQLQLYGHVAHFPDADPAYQIISVRELHEWRKPTGRPCATSLQQVDRHLKEIGMGQHLPGGWPDGGPWSTGGKWTQRGAALAHAPIPDLTYKTGIFHSESSYCME